VSCETSPPNRSAPIATTDRPEIGEERDWMGGFAAIFLVVQGKKSGVFSSMTTKEYFQINMSVGMFLKHPTYITNLIF
jgi:hypothetical protein